MEIVKIQTIINPPKLDAEVAKSMAPLYIGTQLDSMIKTITKTAPEIDIAATPKNVSGFSSKGAINPPISNTANPSIATQKRILWMLRIDL